MAQPRVTDFFASKKKSNGRLPAKRRKVETAQDEDTIPVVQEQTQKSLQFVSIEHNVESVEKSVSISSTKTRRKPRKQSNSKTVVSAPTVRTSRRKGTANVSDNQQTIDNALTNLSNKIIQLDELKAIKTNSKSETPKNEEDTNNLDAESENLSLHWDEADGEDGCETTEITPTKQIKTDSKNERKSRHHFNSCESVTPSVKNGTEPLFLKASTRSARKCLQLHAEEDESVIDGESLGDVDNMVSEMSTLSPKISPLPMTPQKVQHAKTKCPDEPASAKVKTSIKKCKELTESVDNVLTKTKLLTAGEVKSRLKKGGKLEELKKQLLELKKINKNVKKQTPKLQQFQKLEIEIEQISPVASPVKLEKSETRVPAYEKFHHLVSTPPTLTLPYKYKLLAEMFRGMDTVVSMMHNRNESCTYSKLKAAVQSMTKKNFEKKNIGQIKTVYPTAYSFRQERVPMFGQKYSDYQLTVEAKLDDKGVILRILNLVVLLLLLFWWLCKTCFEAVVVGKSSHIDVKEHLGRLKLK